MNTSLNTASILSLKKQLSHAILTHNYDLQSPEILKLSQQLDELMLPIFENQLHFYKSFSSSKINPNK